VKDDMSGWFKFDPISDVDNPAETLGQAVPILDIFDRFNIDYALTGQDQYKTLCLWHEDSNPSLQIYEATHSYFCWVCHKSGNVIDLIAKLMGYEGTPGTLGYNMAIKELCLMAGITSGESVIQFTPPPKRQPEETIEYYIMNASDEIRKFLKVKQGKRGYSEWEAWSTLKFKKMDKMLDQATDDNWEKAKKLYDLILRQMKGTK
jgi:hypothetical protein